MQTTIRNLTPVVIIMIQQCTFVNKTKQSPKMQNAKQHGQLMCKGFKTLGCWIRIKGIMRVNVRIDLSGCGRHPGMRHL